MTEQNNNKAQGEELPSTKSAVRAAERTMPHGLAVSKWTPHSDDPTLIDCIFYRDSQIDIDDHRPHRMTLRSDLPLSGFAGNYRITVTDGAADPGEINLEITPCGDTGFNIEAFQRGELQARGLALVDPHDSRSLLISWWTASVLPYGIVKYSIHDANSLKAYYISEMSPQTPGRGTAIGDTSDGFPGTYALTYEEENGSTWGPFEWTLSARGDMIDLVWRLDGNIVCAGFGFIDPHSQSVIVNYFAVRD